MRKRRSSCLPVLAVLAALAACGGDPQQGAAEEVVDRYRDALVEGDGATACAQLSKAQRTMVRRSVTGEARPATCEEAIELMGESLSDGIRNAIREAEITIDVTGDYATAELGGTGGMELELSGGRWIITRTLFVELA